MTGHDRKKIGVCLPSGEHIIASFGFLVPSFREALAQEHDLRILPEYVYQLAPETQLALLERFVSGLDMLFVWHSRFPSFLRMLLEVRDRCAPETRMAYVPLGEMPMGACWSRPSIDLFKPGDRMLPSCATDLDLFHMIFEEPSFPSEVFPFWVDAKSFAPLGDGVRAEVRANLGLNPDAIVFVYAGRITAEKNVQAVLQVIERLAVDVPQVRLLLVGPFDTIPFLSHSDCPTDVRNDLIKIIRARPALAQRTLVLGERYGHQELSQLFAASDVFVNLTLHHNENFGLANVEAMAAGLPVVVSDWGGPRDTVPHGVAGFRIPTYQGVRGEHVDVWQAYLRCLALTTDADLRRGMGKAARQHVCETYAYADLPRRLASVVSRTFDEPVEAEASGTRLSAFGAAFHRRFYDSENYDYLPRFDAETMPLYRTLIREYCSRDTVLDLHEDGRFFLASLLVEPREDGTLDVTDPVWPGSTNLSAADEICIVQTLITEGFGTLSSLGEDAKAPLARLLQKGVVVQGLPLNEGPRQAGRIARARMRS